MPISLFDPSHQDHHDQASRTTFGRFDLMARSLALQSGGGGAAGVDAPILVLLFNDGGKNPFWSFYPRSNSVVDASLRNLVPDRSRQDTTVIGGYGLAESALAYAPLFGDGRAAIVPDIGQLDLNQSHPDATSALRRNVLRGSTKETGIYGDAKDVEIGAPDPAASVPPCFVVGQSFGNFALGGSGTYAYTFHSVEQLERLVGGGGLLPLPAKGAFRRMVQEQNSLFKYAGVVQAAYNSTATSGAYPDKQPNTYNYQGLATVSRLIRGSLGAQLYVIVVPGWDDHKLAGVNGGVYFQRQARQAQAITAFLDELSASGHTRVVVDVFSEFGRNQANDSGGTDHGGATLHELYSPIPRFTSARLHSDFQFAQMDPLGVIPPSRSHGDVLHSLFHQWLGIGEVPSPIPLLQ